MTANKAQQFINLMKQQITLVDALLNVLTAEKKALSSRQFADLETLAFDKEQLANQLEKTKSESSKSDLQEYLAQSANEETIQIKELNNQLAEKLNLCREKNTINGQVIVANLNTRQEIVNILSGQNTAEAINLYTPAGNIKSALDSGRHEEV